MALIAATTVTGRETQVPNGEFSAAKLKPDDNIAPFK